MKLLIVEDETTTANFLRRGLAEEGFEVEVAADAVGANAAVEKDRYDLILLDIMLPGEDGLSLCARWRAGGLAVPILFLTARDEIADRVAGLNLGGDDYLVKPFAFEELLARVRALLRRLPAAGVPAEIHTGDLTLDTSRRKVTRGGRHVPLSGREYQILECLARNAGHVVSRSVLWEQVWGGDSGADSNVVDVYIRYLRNKLGRDPDLIATVRGSGYRLELQPLQDAEREDGNPDDR
jgi:two-component system copper resistance phosphate regulon response regulator CusR